MNFSIRTCFIIFCLFHLSLCLPFKDLPSTNALQDKIISQLNPQPILDTLTDAEKCCNEVQHEIGKKLLNVYTQFSSFAANAFQIPKQKVLGIGKSVTQALDVVGGKLVGLM